MAFELVSITLLEEDVKEDYTRLTLSFLSEESDEPRTVVLYWYRRWPTHGPPHTEEGHIYPRPLVEMMLTVRADRRKTDRRRTPLVVQCDDGISRTGAYIVLDQVQPHPPSQTNSQGIHCLTLFQMHAHVHTHAHTHTHRHTSYPAHP